MNNFVFSQDPLLFQSYSQPPQTDASIKQQMDDAYIRYKNMQDQYKNFQRPEYEPKDKLKELNDLLVSLNPEISGKILENIEYVSLIASLQKLIQDELLANIKWKVNSNEKAIKNMERQIEIINDAKKECEAEERKNLSELNDYMKNYSNITFDEYKRIKNGENIENDRNKKAKK